MRHGKGRFEKDHKVISGNYKLNSFQIASAVDLDEVMKPLYHKDLPKNMQIYLKSKNLKRSPLSVEADLNDKIKPGLFEVLKLNTQEGLIKGHIFRKIRLLLKDKSVLRDLNQEIYSAFFVIPNNDEILQIFREIIPKKLENGDLRVKWAGINFDDKKTPEFELSHMIVTNDVVFGFGMDNGERITIDGICGDNGSMFIFSKRRGEVRTLKCICGPNYITGIDNKEMKFCIIPDLSMYKGFFMEDNGSEKRIIRYFMKIEGGVIYGFGRDNIGVYMITGTDGPSPDEDPRSVIQFTNFYTAGYSVSFFGRMDRMREIVKMVS